MSRERQAVVIEDVASQVGTNPVWLDALINFETAGTYSPTIKNPHSSARGLIQLTDAPARDLGFRDSLEAVTKFPEFETQMYGVVLPYLKMQIRRRGPLSTKQALYMSVFYPAFMSASPDTTFPDSVRAVNKNIDRVSDYVNFVEARIKAGNLRVAGAAEELELGRPKIPPVPTALLVVAGAIAYLVKTHRWS